MDFKSQYIRSNFTHKVLTDTWNLFKDKLMHAFQDVGQAQTAIEMILTVQDETRRRPRPKLCPCHENNSLFFYFLFRFNFILFHFFLSVYL